MDTIITVVVFLEVFTDIIFPFLSIHLSLCICLSVDIMKYKEKHFKIELSIER